MLDQDTLCQPTADVVAAIESLRPAKAMPANYNTPEGVLFRKAMGLIEDERNWCKGSYGFDKPLGPWCSAGALYCVGASCYKELQRSMFGGEGVAISVFNDTHTHAEVMAKWRECGIANGWL